MGTREYTIPSQFKRLTRVTWDTVKLKKIDLTMVDQNEGTSYGGTPTNGNPTSYYEYAGKIGLSPIPGSIANIKLWGTGTPATITTASTAFSIPDDLADPIADYCLWRMYLKDDDPQRAQICKANWNEGLVEVNDEWRDQKGADAYYVVKDVSDYDNTEQGMI